MNILELKRKLLPMSGPQMSMGGGGGGSGTGTQTQISELPEWARGYAKSTLEKGAALSDKPYQTYGGDRIAGFSPLQQQSQQAAANMQPNAATGAGINVAGQAAMQGLNQDYNGMMARSQNFGNRSAAQYMSPYMEQALAPQLREAQRSSDIMGQQNAAKAVGQGAFGGSRAALVEAERQRNLGTQMGDIRAKGLQDAYSQAQQQFNADQARNLQAQQMNIGQQQFGANLGLQGLNTALQGANALGQLGGQQFQQGMDINKLQNAYGGQQQALQQQGLSQAYEDFQNQQNYPYKQLGFMSDLIRGLPLGQQTATQMYAPNPSAAQNVAALGAGAYGLSKFMADGGMAYADGGSVDAPDNIERIVSKLSDQQLQQAAQAAQARGDMDQLEAIQSEMAMRASERNGLASAVTPQMASSFAGGGILAFAGDEEDNDPVSGQLVTGVPNKAALQEWMEAQKALKEYKASPAMTKAERAAMDQENFDRFQKFAGEDPYAPMAERLKTFETDRAKALEEGKGLAALQAIPAILQGGNAARGIGAGIGALGGNLAAVAKADAAEKRALASMDFNIKDAQRKERMGLTKDAIASTTEAQKDRIAADKAQLEALKARAKGATDAGRAFRTSGAGAGAGGKLPQVDRLAGQIATQIVDLKAKNPNDPQIKVLQSKLDGLKDVIAATKTADKGPEVLNMEAQKLAAMTDKDIDAQVRKDKFMNADWQDAMGDSKKQAEVERRMRNEILTRRNQVVNKNSAGSGKLKFDDQGNPTN